MAFDYEAALKAGGSEDQILDYLSKTRGYNVQTAINAGAKKRQIIDFLSKTGRASAPEPANASPGFQERLVTGQPYKAPIISEGNWGERVGAQLKQDISALPRNVAIGGVNLAKGSFATGQKIGEGLVGFGERMAENLAQIPGLLKEVISTAPTTKEALLAIAGGFWEEAKKLGKLPEKGMNFIFDKIEVPAFNYAKKTINDPLSTLEDIHRVTVERPLETAIITKTLFDATKNFARGTALEKPLERIDVGVQKVAKPVLRAGELALQAPLKAVELGGRGIKEVGRRIYSSFKPLTADEARVVQRHEAKVAFAKRELQRLPRGSEEYLVKQEEIQSLQAQAPKTAPQTGLEKGISGTERMVGRTADVEKMDLWKNQVEPALRESEARITKTDLFSRARARVAAEVNPVRKEGLQKALDYLEGRYIGVGKYDLLKANKLKTSLDKFTPAKIFKGQDVSSYIKTLEAEMAKAIRQKTYASLPGAETTGEISIKEAYRDYANLKELEKVGIRALTQAKKQGGFGSMLTSLYEEPATAIKTVGGQVLYRVGDAFEFIGREGIKTLGEFLRGKGIKLPKISAGLSIQEIEQANPPVTGNASGKIYDNAMSMVKNKNLSQPLDKMVERIGQSFGGSEAEMTAIARGGTVETAGGTFQPGTITADQITRRGVDLVARVQDVAQKIALVGEPGFNHARAVQDFLAGINWAGMSLEAIKGVAYKILGNAGKYMK